MIPKSEDFPKWENMLKFSENSSGYKLCRKIVQIVFILGSSRMLPKTQANVYLNRLKMKQRFLF